jgi:hypothetical protein
MTGYIECAPGPVGTGLDGAVRLFRKVWPVVTAHRDSVEVLVRHGHHRGLGSVGRLLSQEQAWTRLGPFAALPSDVQGRLQDLTEFTLVVFFLFPTELAGSVLAALSGTERQRRDDLEDLPLSDPERAVLADMLRLCADGRSLLVGAADEGNLAYLFGDVGVLTNVEQAGR